MLTNKMEPVETSRNLWARELTLVVNGESRLMMVAAPETRTNIFRLPSSFFMFKFNIQVALGGDCEWVCLGEASALLRILMQFCAAKFQDASKDLLT